MLQQFARSAHSQKEKNGVKTDYLAGFCQSFEGSLLPPTVVISSGFEAAPFFWLLLCLSTCLHCTELSDLFLALTVQMINVWHRNYNPADAAWLVIISLFVVFFFFFFFTLKKLFFSHIKCALPLFCRARSLPWCLVTPRAIWRMWTPSSSNWWHTSTGEVAQVQAAIRKGCTLPPIGRDIWDSMKANRNSFSWSLRQQRSYE